MIDAARVSACSYAVRDLPLERALDVIAAAGFRKVDLLERATHFSLDPRACDPAAVKAAAERRGLRIANLATYVGRGFGSAQEADCAAELERTQRAIDLAAFFGARSIRVRPGEEDPATLDRLATWFRRSAQYAAQSGIYLGFETHHGGISGDPLICRELAQRVGSPFFGVLFDPCNTWQDGVDYRLAFRTFKDWIVHVHLKDGRAGGQGFVHTIPGEGEVDLAWVVRELEAAGYQGDWALEYEVGTEPAEAGLGRFYRAFMALG